MNKYILTAFTFILNYNWFPIYDVESNDFMGA